MATLLTDLDIPKLTPMRAAQLGAVFTDAQALLDAHEHTLAIAGLPVDTAKALIAWLENDTNASLLVRSAQAQMELRMRLPNAMHKRMAPARQDGCAHRDAVVDGAR